MSLSWYGLPGTQETLGSIPISALPHPHPGTSQHSQYFGRWRQEDLQFKQGYLPLHRKFEVSPG